ncbi:hypothetical protein DFJ58DRAFT_725691 [Suillus subalutaceus]|uniref:uncharacterized protein n=1 Tax=Suillus subalutaceus TaxID=48586 RepID=UPI001B87EBE2|nr:uncharacterized protein DFJ58DRAFT_725691 [Suillus subalutaceus]KAG1861509.1 hypothetical protein DFJ58DRAFT_725691 [Suillus subalutaceus]
MSQWVGQMSKLQGHSGSVNLNLRIELLCNANQNSEELTGHDVLNEVDVGDNNSSAGHIKAPLLLVENNETEEAVQGLKKCAEHTGLGINTCSPHQIAWDAPSPIQTKDEGELEVE